MDLELWVGFGKEQEGTTIWEKKTIRIRIVGIEVSWDSIITGIEDLFRNW